MTPSAASDLYKHHRFPGEIISHAVWLYFRFPLSHRDVEELLFVRGVMVSYEAIRKWCRKFGQQYANQLRATGTPYARVQVLRPGPTISLRIWADCPALPTAAPSLVRARVSPRNAAEIPGVGEITGMRMAA